MIDIDKIKKAIDEDLANPNGYWNTLLRKQEATEARFPRVEKYVNDHGMDSIIDRLIQEHDDKWSDLCWKKGYETYPNNKFRLLWDWIKSSHEPVDNELIPQDFLGASYFVKGYWFCIYCGQGCFYRVYDSNINAILQI